MSELHAGILCTVMTLSLCAALHSCLCAFYYGGLWTAVTVLLFFLSGAVLMLLLRWIDRHVSQISIKESCDRLPAALCFAAENGRPRLMNLRMDELSHALTGEALLNANRFWAAISGGNEHSIVTLPDGRTWSFERTRMNGNGEGIYQIIGVDVTAEDSSTGS